MPTGIYNRTDANKKYAAEMLRAFFKNKEKVRRYCIDCGKVFTHRCITTKRCSDCYKKYRLGKNNSFWKGGLITKRCIMCNVDFNVYPYRKDSALFCSRSCSSRHFNLYNVTQEERKQRANKYRGERCHLWKGGITPLAKKIRQLPEYKIWIKNIFSRDAWTCQKCSARGIELHVHHICSFSTIYSDFINKYNMFSHIEDEAVLLRIAASHEPFWNLNNGKTLCSNCHYSLHKEQLSLSKIKG